VTYGFGELDLLVSAYAATVHKSQGSEYPAVVIPVLTQHYPTLQRNLLYARVARGRRLVILVGQKKAVAIAARNASSQHADEPCPASIWPMDRIGDLPHVRMEYRLRRITHPAVYRYLARPP
jgi:hypothetical protein